MNRGTFIGLVGACALLGNSLGFASEEAASGVPMVTDELLFPRQGDRFFRIPGLGVTTQGTLLAFASERKGSIKDFGHDTDVVLRRSFDNGMTWTDPEKILTKEGVDFHSGPVVVDRETGSIFKFARSHGAQTKPGTDWRENFVLRSDDDGRTWRTSVLDLSNERASFRFGPGNGGHGIQIADGRLVVQGGYYRTEGGEDHMSFCLIESIDHGETWRVMDGSDLDNTHFEFCIAETIPGRIYLNMREKYTPTRMYSVIEPGASTISEAKPVTGLPSCQCRSGMAKVADDDKAYLYLTGPTGNKDIGRRMDLALFRSAFEGVEWERVALIHQGKAAYSDLIVLPDGALGCLYETGHAKPEEEIRFVRVPKAMYVTNVD